MSDHIVNQLIIAAGQFERFREQRYRTHFETLLEKLQSVTGITKEQAVQLLLENMKSKGEAA